MVKINTHIMNILKEEVKKKNPRIRLYKKINGAVYSYNFENNEGYIGNKTDVAFEKEILNKEYKGITIIIDD